MYRKIIALISALTCSLSLSSCMSQKAEIEESKMSIEEKIGQLFLARCPESSNLKSTMALKPAGMVMFGRDFENLSADEVKKKIEKYRSMSDIPLIIAVDEEGGTVTRVSSNPNLAPEKYLSPQEYYSTGGFDALDNNTREKSQLLKDLGINLNLAPVADVSQNPNDFIYKRSMGLNAADTAECIRHIVSVMKEENIGSCLKHFPGYGSNADTHTGSALDTRSREEFDNSDFLPFISGIEAGADCVLVSHNIVECIDSEKPASISKNVIDTLRNDLHFNGIAITDDMAMEAVKSYEKPYVSALKAGENLIIATDFEDGFNEIYSAVKSGEVLEEEIDRAIEKTLNFKKQIMGKDG